MRRNSHKTVGAESPQVQVCVMCGDSRATKIGVRSSGDDVQSFLVIRYACRSQIIVRLHIKMRLHPNQGKNWEPDLYSRHRDHIEIVGKYLYRRLHQLCLNIWGFFVEGLKPVFGLHHRVVPVLVKVPLLVPVRFGSKFDGSLVLFSSYIWY